MSAVKPGDKVKVRRCGAKKQQAAPWSGPHVCSRPKNHKGKHRCYRPSDGSLAKPRSPATPCGHRW